MFEFQRYVFRKNPLTVTVTDKTLSKANELAKDWGYLPYELTKRLYDCNQKVGTMFKVWNITDKGNITMRTQRHCVPMEYQYFIIPMYKVIEFLEDKGFKIEINYANPGYTWRLIDKDGDSLWSEPNQYTNDWYDTICDIITEYLDEYCS